MIVDAEKNGAQFSSKNDSRITKVGKFIRATRLDELPQLLNIINGDMSIVGPRPERQQYIDEFCKETPEFTYRLKVKAGLTGYAQIYGKYNTTPLDKLKLDLMYIEKYSILLDIRLIFLTLKIMFMKESTEGVEEGQNHA
jgi:lipopolysaccharide/colanic/teichoic acid biosynthesis glycosyltransferase